MFTIIKLAQYLAYKLTRTLTPYRNSLLGYVYLEYSIIKNERKEAEIKRGKERERERGGGRTFFASNNSILQLPPKRYLNTE